MLYNFDEIIPRENTDCLKYDDKLNRFGRNDIQPMWVADMDFRVPVEISAAFRKIVEHGIYGYHIKTAKYNQAIVDWFQKRHSFSFQSENIVFTPGVVPAISYLIQSMTEKGEKIIIQPPVYYPFFWVIHNNQRQVVYNQLLEKNNEYCIDFDDLEEKARDAKILILCNPHNPVGRVWTHHELTRIAEICLRNRVTIISDEIHNDLVFAPNKHIPIATLSPEVDAITITCHSASKTFNLAGLSTAYVITNNQELKKKFKDYMSNLHVDSLNPFGLIGMVEAFTHGQTWLEELIRYIWKNYQYLCQYIQQNIPQIQVTPLEATYMVWLNFKSLKLSDKDLKLLIIDKAHLGLNDGPSFGPGGSGFQRINIACPRSVLQTALENLKLAIQSTVQN
jgi:cysteine-S-conjugate beta-lyase